MTSSSTNRAPVERIADIKSLLLELLKEANAISSSTIPIIDAIETDTPIDYKQLESISRAIQDLFNLLGMALSDVLYLHTEIIELQQAANATQTVSEVTKPKKKAVK